MIKRNTSHVLNMTPSNKASAANNLWFISNWKLEKQDQSHLAYKHPRMPQLGVNRDIECKCTS